MATRRMLTAVALGGLLVAGCGAGPAGASAGCTETVSGAVEGAVPLAMDDHAFAPACLVGAPSALRLVVRNRGRVPHTLTIDEQGVDRTLDAGEVAFVDIEVPDGGVTFVCRFHVDEGMVAVVRP